MAKVPTRTCISCRARYCKGKFLRVVKRTDGLVMCDLSGKLAGRGAYVCWNERCVDSAFKGNKIARALRIGVLGQIRTELEDVLSRHGACE